MEDNSIKPDDRYGKVFFWAWAAMMTAVGIFMSIWFIYG